MTKQQLLRTLIMTAIFSGGVLAGYGIRLAHPDYQSGYDRALEDVAAGEVIIESQVTRAKEAEATEFTREVEYVRVVSAVAETYGKDPSEVEVECGLVDERGEVRR